MVAADTQFNLRIHREDRALHLRKWLPVLPVRPRAASPREARPPTSVRGGHTGRRAAGLPERNSDRTARFTCGSGFLFFQFGLAPPLLEKLVHQRVSGADIPGDEPLGFLKEIRLERP